MTKDLVIVQIVNPSKFLKLDKYVGKIFLARNYRKNAFGNWATIVHPDYGYDISLQDDSFKLLKTL